MPPRSRTIALRDSLRFRPRAYPSLASLPHRTGFVSKHHSSQASDNEHEDFFRYTSGRWLWNEKSQLQRRYRRFDVAALKRVAAQALGARECVSISKLSEGYANKAYLLAMDNNSAAVAVIPSPCHGNNQLAVKSEAASLRFARDVLKIPAPRLIAYSSDAENAVGAEYLIMEQATGLPTAAVWQGLGNETQEAIIYEYIGFQSKLCSVTFKSYGSLYLADDAFEGCVAADVDMATSQISQDTAEMIKQNFVIGPAADEPFWRGRRADMALDRGPWTTASAAIKATVWREIKWLNEFSQTDIGETNNRFIPPSRAGTVTSERSPETHKRLYERFLLVLPSILPKDPGMLRPYFWSDMHPEHILIKEGHISNVIGWHNAAVSPLYWVSIVPFFVDPYHVMQLGEVRKWHEEMQTEVILGLGDTDDFNNRFRQRMMLFFYEPEVRKKCPILHKCLSHPESSHIRTLRGFGKNTWDEGLIEYRQQLRTVQHLWSTLTEASTDPCPLDFTEEEHREAERETRAFKEWANLWHQFGGAVNFAGRVDSNKYEASKHSVRAWRSEAIRMSEAGQYPGNIEELKKGLEWVDE